MDSVVERQGSREVKRRQEKDGCRDRGVLRLLHKDE